METVAIDEASEQFRDGVIPKCQSQKGYKGAYFLADRRTGDCLPMTIWDTEEDMMATEKNRFFQEQLIKFMVFFKKPPVREAYEVVFEEKK